MIIVIYYKLITKQNKTKQNKKKKWYFDISLNYVSHHLTISILFCAPAFDIQILDVQHKNTLHIPLTQVHLHAPNLTAASICLIMHTGI